MDGPWEYHAEWNKSEKVKNHRIHSYLVYKTESNKWTNKKRTKARTHKQVYGGCQRVGGVVRGKGDEIYGDGR